MQTVRAHDERKFRVGHLFAQSFQRPVGIAIAVRVHFPEGEHEMRISRDRQARHFRALHVRGAAVPLPFMRRPARRHDPYDVKAQLLVRTLRDHEVPEVNGIERPAQNTDL